MTVALVTGSSGFLGKHLVEALGRRPDTAVRHFGRGDGDAALADALAAADFVFHLAGVNRPKDEGEFEAVNVGLTARICEHLRKVGRRPLFALASSAQAEQDNPYGRSKRRAEEEVSRFAREAEAPAAVFRLRNVFGKWCRPNYNSVVATFCHNVANDLPISISDPSREVSFVYVDDVIGQMLAVLDGPPNPGVCELREVTPVYPITLDDLADRIRSFREVRETLVLPNLSDRFTQRLYATYLSYLPERGFGYALEQKSDSRGALAEFLKSKQFGQIFVSRTKPGITRGNHYHHTKTEKFLVLEGEAIVRFRHILSGEVLEYPVAGADFRVIDIPPGYTHSIENVGDTELVTLFWASEIFDPTSPDTYYLAVQNA